MYRLEPKDYVTNAMIGLWGILAFQAGFINSLGFLLCQRFVSHVTGFGTHVGIFIGKGNYWTALELFTAPLSFIAGAWFNGYLTVARSARGEKPRYDIVVILIPVIVLTLMISGAMGWFGTFGANLSFNQDFILLNSFTFLCGMQNACFATLTKGQIRTTHLTGISTDIGTDLALSLNGRLTGEEKIMAQRRNLMRIVTFSSFSFGALFSALIDGYLKFWAFSIPLVTSITVVFVFRSLSQSIDEKKGLAS